MAKMGRPKFRTEEDIKRTQRQCRERQRIKKWKIVLDHLADKCCVECGIDDILVLEFDHCYGEKSFDISASVSRNVGTYQQLKDELLKCRVLCRNCHVRHHHKERNTQKWQRSKELGLV